jgi:hypothetical protein
MNSLYTIPHHLCYDVRQNTNNFLNNNIFSFDDNNENTNEAIEIMEDRNIYTKERYKNIFELRHIKIDYMIKILPLKVKNYIFIRYEDLLNDFENTMNKFKTFNLKINDNIIYPLNTNNDVKHTGLFSIKKRDIISKEMIYTNKNFLPEYEKYLKYI